MNARQACLFCILGAALTAATPVHAQSWSSRLQGLGPDAQLVGGAGIGVGRSLDNPFLGRARIGLLYAYEPWIGALGPSLEVGALAHLGFGGELEVSRFDGWFADLGVARVTGDAWQTHLALGFMVFGLEWQHRFDARDDDALLLEIRLPLGTSWFLKRKREEQDRQRHGATR